MPEHCARLRAVIVGILGVLVGCTTSERAPDVASGDVLVTVRQGAITAPDSVRPGWTRVRVEEAENAHIIVVFRLPVATTTADVAAFIAALDTAPATPRPGVALGGPEVGAQGEVIVHLTPSVYVLACVRRGDDGHRHASTGEFRVLHVPVAMASDTAFAAPPRSTQTVRMVDFAYVGPDHWAPGAQLLRIANTGKQDHQLLLVRLRDGASLQAWMTADDPDTVATPVAGMARVSSGEVAYLPVELTPGNYIAYCLVADVTTKKPHIALGMLRAIQVP